ncbi:MAG: hypothetical protein RLZZ397_483 [Pseudomonadota bacterium]|jgi:glycosyltransferase involved in cell wall biosynthesis
MKNQFMSATTFEIDHLNAAHTSLRVAVVSETWPPEINGVAMTMHRLATELQSRGHSIQVIRPKQANNKPTDSPFDETLTFGIPIPAYPQLRLGLPAKRLMTQLWTRQRPDVVHIATEGPLGWSAMQAAKKFKIPVSSDFRTNFHSYGQHYGVGGLKKAIASYLRKFHNHTHFTTVPTLPLKHELSKLGFQRLEVIGRGIDTQKFTPEHRSVELRARWGCASNERVYLYVGRLAAEKNPQLLAKAWKRIQLIDPQAKLVLVGDGPAAENFRRLMPDGIFAGSKVGTELAQHYASSDVFLFPSMTETYGNVVPEALASGLMSLTFDYAASAELIRHDINGWVARMGDDQHYENLASELAMLDYETMQLMRVQARTTMQQRGWDVITGQMEQLWRQLLTEHATRANGLKWHANPATTS